ncbi:MAG: Transcriptional regulator, TrmB [Candidatus Peregrinibacteria bacterium GW2011_GWA2_33_10]|nr:MAG: Transcriptional regulator, TrmB [Candidatus Peregrinibacteria bacterium GW2011_GWA2_33_10]KKP40854.1 MAG: transcriptional regulator TrmB [Candidatus Peregrinibacteria bacterium GW2011_GWC2_33_13]
MLEKIFQKLNLDQKEYRIFTSLYRLGTNPASVIAKHTGFERTNTYRILKKLNKLGLISITKKAGIQYFYIENEKTILKYIENQKNELTEIQENYSLIESELKNLRPESLNPPKIKIYDQNPKQIFDDIINEIKSQNLTTIRLLASETFTEQTGRLKLKDIGELFIKNLTKFNIKIDALVAEGMLTRERLSPLTQINSLFDLPASNGATNFYLVGNTVFIILFKENIIGVQLSHPDIAQALHFIFDQLQKK